MTNEELLNMLKRAGTTDEDIVAHLDDTPEELAEFVMMLVERAYNEGHHDGYYDGMISND